MNTFNLIEAIYGLTGLAMVFFYIPQIKLLAQAETMATSISIPTWSIWSLGNLTNFIYGYLKLGDIKFSILALLSGCCCSIILIIAVYKKIKYQNE